ncbi:uncharacterized protein N7483_001055 [Penicillium malachiteum]|uniref:uncharacterized protein n=1 Tax=Penicillium malachiteum TaxID=1324776 RepID=UPI002547108F|nr:uncharacterized protein N7483_001055 [Penicillium malachiteum]KAJ5735930.1 hypothetical protein N7483_001055 [Penicillium malachiteum]
MAYPTTTAPDPRIGMEPRYTPEYERSRPQPTRERDPHRRRFCLVHYINCFFSIMVHWMDEKSLFSFAALDWVEIPGT